MPDEPEPQGGPQPLSAEEPHRNIEGHSEEHIRAVLVATSDGFPSLAPAVVNGIAWDALGLIQRKDATIEAQAREIERLNEIRAENAKLRERVAKLAAFAHTAIDNAFEGCDMDGGEIQDHLTELGLLIETKYDPMKHGEQDADPGDPWFVVVDWLAKLRGEE